MVYFHLRKVGFQLNEFTIYAFPAVNNFDWNNTTKVALQQLRISIENPATMALLLDLNGSFGR